MRVSVKFELTRSKRIAVLKNYEMKTPILMDLLYSDFLSSPMKLITLTKITFRIVLTPLIEPEIPDEKA